MHVVIEKLLLDTLLTIVGEAIHRHPHNVISQLIADVQKNVRIFQEAPAPEEPAKAE